MVLEQEKKRLYNLFQSIEECIKEFETLTASCLTQLQSFHELSSQLHDMKWSPKSIVSEEIFSWLSHQYQEVPELLVKTMLHKMERHLNECRQQMYV
jgi:hypothetical protein